MADPKSETTPADEEIGALHCLGMCADWEGHPAYQGDDDEGLRAFLLDCAAGLRWQRDEIARLRAGWRPIATAPLDRPVLVYAAPRYDLPGFQAVAQWHEDAGWCVCELRDATHWQPLPEAPK